MLTVLLIGSANADVGMDAGWQVLASGGTALDAVESAVREVESNATDHTVGLGGYPNLLGVVELDASIMDGATRRAGAVGGLQGYRHAITAARAVLDRLPHVLVTGEGAARIAAIAGLTHEDLLTEDARRVWLEGLDGRLPDEFRREAPVTSELLSAATHLAADPDTIPGTVNVLAIDARGQLASAVSTSGWAWKFPGRLGDSPVIGAGNYADGRYGAATCTGWGELALRCATARTVVDELRRGKSPRTACEVAIADISDLPDLPAESVISLIALHAGGGYAAVSTVADAEFVVRTDAMPSYEVGPRDVIPLR